jgi:superfamily I DNA and/or RNA helicase
MLQTKLFQNLLKFESISLSELVFEEASQVAQSTLISILFHYPQVRRVCLIGDVHQLPPHGTTNDYEVMSILQAFHAAGGKSIFLCYQYRMPKPLADIVSECIYDGRVVTLPDLDCEIRECLSWIDVRGKEAKVDGSKENQSEVLAIIKLIEDAGELIPVDNKSLANIVLLTGYRSQLLTIRKQLGKRRQRAEIALIDSFQGRDKPIVILSLVGTESVGFFRDSRRTNVAVTRMLNKLFIVGDLDFWQGSQKSCQLISMFARSASEEGAVVQYEGGQLIAQPDPSIVRMEISGDDVVGC